MKLIRLWWHCLVRCMRLKEDHRMCWRRDYSIGSLYDKIRYCSCGWHP